MTNVVAHISPPAAAPLLNFNCVHSEGQEEEQEEHSPPPPLSLMRGGDHWSDEHRMNTIPRSPPGSQEADTRHHSLSLIRPEQIKYRVLRSSIIRHQIIPILG